MVQRKFTKTNDLRRPTATSFRIYRGILPMLKKNNASMVVSLANKPYSMTQPASLKIIKSQNWQLILKQPPVPPHDPTPVSVSFLVVFFSGPVSVSKESQAVTSRDIPKGPHLLTPVNSKKPRSKKKTCWDPMVAISTCLKISPSQVPCKKKPAAHGFQQTKIPGKMRRIASAEAGTSEENLFE